MVWFGTSFTASAYATGGLETQAQTCLLTWACVLALRPSYGPRARARAVALSAIGAALVWLRFDSAPLVGILLGRAAFDARSRRAHLAALLAPFAVGCAGLVIFKEAAFGALLPNTFYAKGPSLEPRTLQGGAEYVLSYLREYGLLPYAVGFVALLPRATRTRNGVLLPVACVTTWIAYVVSAGGDFMEFRFVVPVLPMAFSALAVVLFEVVCQTGMRIALAAAVVLESGAYEYATYDQNLLQDGPGVETIHGLATHLDAASGGWIGVGQELKRAFDADPRVTIAVGAAGAVPYYSELRTIDEFGLSDAWVARHGVVGSRRPGHRRGAQLSYLIERGVNLAWALDARDPTIPKDATLVSFPVGSGVAVFVYLVRSPVVDEVIRREGWHEAALPR
jgi:hypothetical protein